MTLVPLHRRLPTLCGSLVVVALGTGCAFIGGRGQDGGPTETGWKLVMEKVAPAYLVAVDRSECTVSARRFEKIRKGDNVFCVWRGGRVAGEPRTEPPRLEPPRTPPQRLLPRRIGTDDRPAMHEPAARESRGTRGRPHGQP